MTQSTFVRAGNPFYSVKKFYHSKKKTIDKNIFVISFLIVPLICFCIFYIYVNIDSFAMAFKRIRTMPDQTIAEYWTFENFQIIGSKIGSSSGSMGDLGVAIVNTLLFNIVSLGLTLPVTTIVCYFITKKILGYRFYRAIFYLPCIIASSALVLLFKFALNGGGPLMVLFSDHGYIYPFSKMAPEGSAILTILIYHFLFGIGGNLIVLGGAMRSVDPQMMEAGQIDGCNWFQEFIYIILPSIWPTISTILILSAAGFLGASGPILAFTKGNYGTTTLSYYIYSLIAGADTTGVSKDLNLASAIGLCMTAISFPLALIVRKVVYGKEG